MQKRKKRKRNDKKNLNTLSPDEIRQLKKKNA